jgi:hypothetical protein
MGVAYWLVAVAAADCDVVEVGADVEVGGKK